MTKTHLVIHHSATQDGIALDWPAIRRFHVQGKGYVDISYHIGFELFERQNVGLAGYEALLGRALDSQAAAAYQQNMNRVGIHALFVGSFDDQRPKPEMIAFAAGHLAAICGMFGIEPDDKHIIPHRQVATYKTCPGLKFPMPELIRAIQERA